MFPAVVWWRSAGVLVLVSVFWHEASSSTTSRCAFVVVGRGSQKSGKLGSQGGQGVQVVIILIDVEVQISRGVRQTPAFAVL